MIRDDCDDCDDHLFVLNVMLTFRDDRDDNFMRFEHGGVLATQHYSSVSTI